MREIRKYGRAERPAQRTSGEDTFRRLARQLDELGDGSGYSHGPGGKPVDLTTS